MEKYQYSESRHGGTTYVETDCWYLLDLPVCKPNISVIKKERENFFEKELNDLEAIKGFDISGLYLLINSDKNKIYVGESSDIKTRANNHDDKWCISDGFDRMILLWDGRPNTISHFGNETFRKTLEKKCIELFDGNSRYDLYNTTKNAKKMDKVVKHTKNSLGFRGEEMPEEFEKYLSIVSVGGSTTEDFFMTDGKTWTAHLGKKLRESFNPIWINNAGLDGHSSFGHTILMNAYISKIKPKVVLFLVGSNDRGIESMQRFDSGLKNGLTLAISSIKAFLRTAGNYSEVLALSYNLYRYLKKN